MDSYRSPADYARNSGESPSRSEVDELMELAFQLLQDETAHIPNDAECVCNAE